jgi:hypothetical protein
MGWLVLIVFALLIPEILSTVLDSRLGRAVAARIERRGGGGESEPLEARIRDLEEELGRLSQEVHRLNEETAFLEGLLADRAGSRRLEEGAPGAGLPPGERNP